MSTLKSWAYLSRVIEGPSPHLQALLRAGRDADELARGVRTRAKWVGPLLPATERRYAQAQPEEDLQAADEHGYTLLTPDSKNWPGEAIQASFGVPQAEQDKGACPPHALWVRGEQQLPALLAQSVGIVGTRAATAYGHHATADLVSGLAAKQYTIVSGGALGVDTVAHDTALGGGAPSIVVAACGPGVVYPRRNGGLFDRVVTQGGAVITEYPPGVTPDRHRFLTRNRLIAALTQGTVIIEAAYRSGALNTLKWARMFNRVAMAVPGPILGAASLGTNLAIYRGQAQMVLSADHIHELLGQIGEFDAEAVLQSTFAPTPLQELSHNELRVYDALPPAGQGGKEADDVAAAAGFSTGLTVHLLLELEQRNLVARDKRIWRRVG